MCLIILPQFAFDALFLSIILIFCLIDEINAYSNIKIVVHVMITVLGALPLYQNRPMEMSAPVPVTAVVRLTAERWPATDHGYSHAYSGR